MNFGLLAALWKGKALANKETWKSVGAVTTVLLGVLTAVLSAFPQLGIPPEAVHAVSVAIANLGAVVFGYQTVGDISPETINAVVGAVITFLWGKYFQVATSTNRGFGKPVTDGVFSADEQTVPSFSEPVNEPVRDVPVQQKNSVNSGAKGLTGGQG